MKLSKSDAAGHVARPRPGMLATLLHGADPMRVSAMRQQLVRAIAGPDGEAEMRLTRLTVDDLRDDRARLSDALRARSFYPGPRVVVLTDATHNQAPAVAAALAELTGDDAHLVVTAAALKPTSPLLKPFAGHRAAAAIAIYDDPPGPDEIARGLSDAGLSQAEPAAREDLARLARTMAPGDFRQLLEKAALYKLDDPVPLSAGEVAMLAPASVEAEIDDMMAVVADGHPEQVGPVLTRLVGQGANPVTLCIGAARHFRAIHALAVDPQGRAFGPNAAAIARQARAWGMARSEAALRLLLDTDLALRSSSNAPQMAVMERALIRIAMMGRR